MVSQAKLYQHPIILSHLNSDLLLQKKNVKMRERVLYTCKRLPVKAAQDLGFSLDTKKILSYVLDIMFLVKYRPFHNVQHMLQRALWKKALETNFFHVILIPCFINFLGKAEKLTRPNKNAKFLWPQVEVKMIGLHSSSQLES